MQLIRWHILYLRTVATISFRMHLLFLMLGLSTHAQHLMRRVEVGDMQACRSSTCTCMYSLPLARWPSQRPQPGQNQDQSHDQGAITTKSKHRTANYHGQLQYDHDPPRPPLLLVRVVSQRHGQQWCRCMLVDSVRAQQLLRGLPPSAAPNILQRDCLLSKQQSQRRSALPFRRTIEPSIREPFALVFAHCMVMRAPGCVCSR